MTEEYEKIIKNIRDDFKTLNKVCKNQWDSIKINRRQLSALQKKVMNIDARLKYLEEKLK